MGIKVVLSDKEASSKPFELMPRGWYKAVISDGEVKESKSLKNAGKPFYSLELTIVDGKYEGRKVFDNVMCFEGALYSVVQLCAAVGMDVEAGEFEIPELSDFLDGGQYGGVEFMISLAVQKERTAKDPQTGEDKTYAERNEVKGYKAIGASTPINSNVRGGSGSLLPS
jgi:hypothetical protein